MARVQITMPTQFTFATEMEIPVAFINRGDHLGNDSLVSCLNEARVRFISERCGSPYGVAGAALINADLAVVYQSEAFHGERLCIEIAADDFHRCGFDLFYRVTVVGDGRAVAQAKTALLLFDLQTKKLLSLPESLQQQLKSAV